MTIVLPHLHTGNVAFPIWIPGVTDLAINQMPDLLHRLKGRNGDFSSDRSQWYDYASGAAYPVTGAIEPGADADFNGASVAAFSSGAYVDLTADMPLAANYSVVLCFKHSGVGNEPLCSSGGSNYHSIHLDPSGHIYVVRNHSGVYSGAVVHPADTATVVIVCFKNAANRTRIYVDNGLESTSSVVQDNVEAAIRIGAIVVDGSYFSGSMAEVMIFARDLSDSDDLDTINTYLAGAYFP